MQQVKEQELYQLYQYYNINYNIVILITILQYCNINLRVNADSWNLQEKSQPLFIVNSLRWSLFE